MGRPIFYNEIFGAECVLADKLRVRFQPASRTQINFLVPAEFVDCV